MIDRQLRVLVHWEGVSMLTFCQDTEPVDKKEQVDAHLAILRQNKIDRITSSN
jgi:hypothetical protein